MGDVIDFKRREFNVGDRIMYRNIGFDSFGKIKAKHGHEYEVEWDDGFVDDLDGDGRPYTYGWDELLRPDEVEE